nr:helix-turn-helix domain-containing protein [Kineosphaera limosa]
MASERRAETLRDAEGPRAPTDEGTRARVLGHVLRLGPVTAAELAHRLDLTPTAVRRHLEWLTDSGDIAPSETAASGTRRGRGRPARHYVVTPAGHRRLDSDSADIATQALRFLARHSGPAAVEEFARERFAALEERYAVAVRQAGDDPRARVDALARELTADGFAATARPVGIDTPLEGVQLCQGHCPMHRVAAEFPQLCDAETQAFARLLGVHVQRLATLSGGEHVCTTFVPSAPESSTRRDSRDHRDSHDHHNHSSTQDERTPR